MCNGKISKYIKNEDGQTLAEFAIVLSVLVILLVWTIQFYDMIAIKHKTCEASRLAAWEVAYQRPQNNAQNRARNIVSNSQTIISAPNGVNVSINNASSINGLSYFTIPPGWLRVQAMQAEMNTFAQTHAEATYGLRYTLGLASVTINSNYGLIYNSWDIVTMRGGSTNGVVENVVEDLFAVFPGLGSTIFGFFDTINDILGPIADFLGQSFDVKPIGHVDLRNVPAPEE